MRRKNAARVGPAGHGARRAQERTRVHGDVQIDVYEREAVFSPEGRQIAFVSQRHEAKGSDIFAARTGGQRLVDVKP